MTISSRTPEGSPERCPVCGKLDRLERSDPTGEFICPSCGQLFLRLRDDLAEWGIPLHEVALQTSLSEIGADSLDIVEWIMEIEEDYGVTVPDKEAEGFRTLGDIFRYIAREIRRREEEQ